MKPSILEYLGTINNGILVLVSIVYKEKYYESTFYYTDKDILLTVSKELETDIGHNIKEDENYIILIKEILKKIAPYEGTIKSLKPINFNRWRKN